MSQIIPKSGGGFLKGFAVGSAVSIAAICTAWVVLPGGTAPDRSGEADVSEAVTVPETVENTVGDALISPNTLDVPDAPASSADAVALSAQTDTAVPQETDSPSALQPVAAAPAVSLPSASDNSETRPVVRAAPALAPAAQDAARAESASPALTVAAAPSAEGITRPPLPSAAGGDAFTTRDMPQDRNTPTFPTTNVARQVPADPGTDQQLDASLPDSEGALRSPVVSQVSRPQVAARDDDTSLIDRQSARVQSAGAAPSQEPGAQATQIGETQSMTIVPISAPSPPRLPRASLTAPQSIFPDPIPLTLPGAQPAPLPQRNEDPAEDSSQVARLTTPSEQPQTVGSLLDSPDPQDDPPLVVDGGGAAAGPAFEAFAEPFEGTLPRIAVVLQDVGGEGIPRGELTGLGPNVTFAVDAGDAGARDAMNAYRDAGFEVLVLASETGELRMGAATQPSEVGDLTQAMFDTLPEAIGLIDRPNGTIFRSNRLVESLAASFAQSGHGFFLHNQFGANRALEAFEAQNVPTGAIMRVIDDDRDPMTIRRVLERAALEAGKSGGVIVYGRTYPETISTLSIWSISRSAQGVDFAPITATVKALQ